MNPSSSTSTSGAAVISTAPQTSVMSHVSANTPPRTRPFRMPLPFESPTSASRTPPPGFVSGVSSSFVFPTPPMHLSQAQWTSQPTVPDFASFPFSSTFPGHGSGIPQQLFLPSASSVQPSPSVDLNLGGYNSVLGSPSYGMPPFPHMINVQNHVTIKLSSPEDYSSWRTQFLALLFSQQLSGFVDGSIPAPTGYAIYSTCYRQVNPTYLQWVRIDQLIRSWLFATLSREVLIEVTDLNHARQVWDCLQQRFQNMSTARALELKRMLTHLHKTESQTMDAFLREVKVIVDSLNAINCPVSDQDLIEYVTFGIGPDYDTLVTTLTNIGPISFTDFKLRLLQYDQRQRAIQARDGSLTQHPAFAVTSQDGTVGGTGSANTSSASTGSGSANTGRSGKGGGYKGKGKKGKGGGAGGQKGNNTSTTSNSKDAATGTVNGMKDASLNNMNLLSMCASDLVSAGSQNSEGIAGSHSFVVCQICNSPGHSAKQCPIRYNNNSTTSNFNPFPAYATLGSGESNDDSWYPDTAAAFHMTPSDGQRNGGGSSTGT